MKILTRSQKTVFAVISWAFFPIVFIFYPETSRRTLEDMDEIFIRNPSLIVCGNPQLTQRDRPETFVQAEQDRISGGIENGKDEFSISTTAHHERV